MSFWMRFCLTVILVGLCGCQSVCNCDADKVVERSFAATQPGVFNVLDYGATGDGVTDDTASIQAALDQAAQAGGMVELPAGAYLIRTQLSIPAGVTLQGIAQAPLRTLYHEDGEVLLDTQSVLLAVAGKGRQDGDPFLVMNTNSTLKGLAIHYPEQINQNPPHAYPWTIQGRGDNCSIINVLMTNPYQAVDFGSFNCGRHYIDGLYAQALYRGIFVDRCYDVGRIQNVHLWPFWKDSHALNEFVSENAIGFIFGRTDWQMVSNTFTIYYKIGFLFTSIESGPGNVMLINSGADVSPTAVKVERSQGHSGITFSNCQIMGPVHIDTTNRGPVRFTGCGFWPSGDTRELIVQEGQSTTIISGSHFADWGGLDKEVPCIRITAGNVLLSAVDFMNRDKPQVILEENAGSLSMTASRLRGGSRIVNRSEYGEVVTAANVEDLEAERRFTPPEGATVIPIDSPNVEMNGDWYRHLGGETQQGFAYWTTPGEGEKKIHYHFTPEKTGRYEIFVWIPDDPNGDHTAAAPYTIHHAEGSETSKVNQQRDLVTWKSLGVYTINQESYLELNNQTKGNLVADAIAIKPVR